MTCLLAATGQGLVLVDTGLGTGDYLRPGRWMRFFTAAMRLPRDLGQTALHQIKRLDYQPEAVRHIVITHLHLDHAGGLPDFPQAQVHTPQPEYEHVMGGHAGIWYVGAH